MLAATRLLHEMHVATYLVSELVTHLDRSGRTRLVTHLVQWIAVEVVQIMKSDGEVAEEFVVEIHPKIESPAAGLGETVIEDGNRGQLRLIPRDTNSQSRMIGSSVGGGGTSSPLSSDSLVITDWY